MKVIIAAHKFNPAHLSHIIALSEIFRSRGVNVRHRISEKYLELEPNAELTPVSLMELIRLGDHDVFINYAPSFSVLFDSLLLRLFKNVNLIYFLHEPFTGFGSYLQAGFGIFKTIKISLASIVVNLNCKISNIVVLSSMRAYDTEIKRIGGGCKYKKINLLFRDESGHLESELKREYVSYIGTIAEDHAFEEFVNLVYAATVQGRVIGNKFLIATKSSIPEYLVERVEICKMSGLLDVISGAPMTNSEINSYYSRSIAVWNAYKRSMQSGVLPKAYMFGSPVICCENNQSEYFTGGEHGFCIGPSYDIDSFFDSIELIRSNFEKLSKNCREYYLKNFDISSQSKRVLKIVGLNDE